MNAQDLLYPYVVPTSWVDFASTDALVSWQLADDVHIVLVFDGSGTVRTASPRAISELQLNPDDAFDVAAYDGDVRRGPWVSIPAGTSPIEGIVVPVDAAAASPAPGPR